MYIDEGECTDIIDFREQLVIFCLLNVNSNLYPNTVDWGRKSMGLSSDKQGGGGVKVG